MVRHWIFRQNDHERPRGWVWVTAVGLYGIAVWSGLCLSAGAGPWLPAVPLVLIVAWTGGAWAGYLCAVLVAVSRLVGIGLGTFGPWDGWRGLARETAPFVLLSIVAVLTAFWKRSEAHGRELAHRDWLTGLLNGRGFSTRVEAERSRSVRLRRPLAVAYLDCDRFKAFNDTRGHPVGDELLQRVAEILRDGLRSYDVVARPGGDEFAVLLPETGPGAAQTACERLRNHLRASMRDRDWPVTFSVGVAVWNNPPQTAEEMIAAADELMYLVKGRGGDGLECRLLG